MRAAIVVHGAGVSVATLQTWCPTASRRAIARWVRQDRQQRRNRLHVVHWTQPGRVWAMDFSTAPSAIEGQYRGVLHVRDLASQYHLAALPVARASAAAACGLLRALCARVDAPLVLKVDNGSAFVSGDLQAWARAAGTHLLHSPPACPRYNGAIEASIGAITTRAHHAAATAGHPEHWTCEDVELARITANATVRSPDRRSAEQRWHQAAPITRAERRRFAVYHAAAQRRKMSVPMRVRCRMALVETLRSLGYVSITRRADLVQQLPKEKRQKLRT